MPNESLIYRIVGEYVHFLNCSSGMVRSFELEDGKEIIKNLDSPEELKYSLSKSTYSFLFKNRMRMKPRDLRVSLMALGSEFSFPTTVNIELNRRCVLRCKHCYIPFSNLNRKEGELFDNYSIKDIKNLFQSLKNMGVFLVILTGGEPFLNKNFRSFLDEATKLGMVVEIFSNLQQIPRWFAEDDNKYRVNRFQTSIYSIDPKVHDLVTSGKGSLKNTLKNLKLIKGLGYRVEVASPLMCFNFETRMKTKKYFADRHITQSFSWPIVNEYYEGHKGKDTLNITKDQFIQFVEENPDFMMCPAFENMEHICSAGRLLFSISAEGDVFPCSQFPRKMGNIKEESIENIMRGRRMCGVACLSPKDIDKKEYLYNFCMGNNYSETGDPLKVSEFSKKMYKQYENYIKRKEVK